MNTDQITKWITALRSGQYKQGQGQLRLNDAYCCLGVYCDMVDSSQWYNFCNRYAYWSESTSLPDLYKAQLNLSPRKIDYLIRMNDELEYTFDQIADELDHLIRTGSFTIHTLALLESNS